MPLYSHSVELTNAVHVWQFLCLQCAAVELPWSHKAYCPASTQLEYCSVIVHTDWAIIIIVLSIQPYETRVFDPPHTEGRDIAARERRLSIRHCDFT
jgi:hypothetical protein